MRTLLACALLLLVTVMGARVLDENRLRFATAESGAGADDTTLSFLAYRTAAIAFAESLTPAGRTAFVLGEDGAGAREISEGDLEAFLDDGWEMPAADGGEAAWEAWLALYTDGAGDGQTPSGDGFGAAANRHAVLYVLSRLGTEADAALVLSARAAADRPAGMGLACLTEDGDTSPCEHAAYLGLGLPVATLDGLPVMEERSLVSATLFERAPFEGED